MHMWTQGVHGQSLASQFFLRTCNWFKKYYFKNHPKYQNKCQEKKKTLLHTTSMCVLHILLYKETYA